MTTVSTLALKLELGGCVAAQREVLHDLRKRSIKSAHVQHSWVRRIRNGDLRR